MIRSPIFPAAPVLAEVAMALATSKDRMPSTPKTGGASCPLMTRTKCAICTAKRGISYYLEQGLKVRFGLVLWFFHQSVMIEPVHASPLLACTGGGWIVLGLVYEDRF